jgi:predicted TIM-barrel fold metal-dependent hydrolase
VSLQLRGYRELLDAAHVQLAGIEAAARDAILGGNARRVYRLESVSAAAADPRT